MLVDADEEAGQASRIPSTCDVKTIREKLLENPVPRHTCRFVKTSLC